MKNDSQSKVSPHKIDSADGSTSVCKLIELVTSNSTNSRRIPLTRYVPIQVNTSVLIKDDRI